MLVPYRVLSTIVSMLYVLALCVCLCGLLSTAALAQTRAIIGQAQPAPAMLISGGGADNTSPRSNEPGAVKTTAQARARQGPAKRSATADQQAVDQRGASSCGKKSRQRAADSAAARPRGADSTCAGNPAGAG